MKVKDLHSWERKKKSGLEKQFQLSKRKQKNPVKIMLNPIVMITWEEQSFLFPTWRWYIPFRGGSRRNFTAFKTFYKD